MKLVRHINVRTRMLGKQLVAVVLCVVLGACTTARVEDTRQTATGIHAGEGVVIMARSYHLGNETEQKFIDCVDKALGRGSSALRVVPTHEFVDALFPWFEPRTQPSDAQELPDLLEWPGVAEMIADKGVRYLIWIDGDTEKVAGGGSMSCAVGPGGGGCFGFAWWQNDSKYEAAVWDLTALESAGTVSADVSGTSFLPALVIPIPLIARPRAKACKRLADQLKTFIVSDESA
ncbi:MAG: hypothetical protein ACE1Y4_16595 [Lysobacterales bacterium]